VDAYCFNWYYSQYGRVEGDIALVRALARSNDIYFYKAAEWIGANKLAEFATFFGFGKSTDSLLPGEQAGFVPTPEKKETERGERWYLGDTYHFGIGQGELLVTPLQVAQMTQTFAKRGSKCQPSLLRRDTTVCEDVGVEEKNFMPVLQGMLEACSTTGTAFPFFLNEQSAMLRVRDHIHKFKMVQLLAKLHEFEEPAWEEKRMAGLR
jgi:penicillin-binding protein 2